MTIDNCRIRLRRISCLFLSEETFVSMIHIVKEHCSENSGKPSGLPLVSVTGLSWEEMVEPSGRCDDSLESLISCCKMVEPSGIEPLTSCVQGRRSPS